MADMKIYQEVELPLTENLVPTVVHVKQFDHKARKIRCRLYSSSVEYVIPEGAIASCAGTRPDGHGRMAISSSTARRQRRSWCLSKKTPSSLPSRISCQRCLADTPWM